MAAGLLVAGDPDVAAGHVTLLTFTDVADRSYDGALPIAGEIIERVAAGGVVTSPRLYGTGAAGAAGGTAFRRPARARARTACRPGVPRGGRRAHRPQERSPR